MRISEILQGYIRALELDVNDFKFIDGKFAIKVEWDYENHHSLWKFISDEEALGAIMAEARADNKQISYSLKRIPELLGDEELTAHHDGRRYIAGWLLDLAQLQGQHPKTINVLGDIFEI